MWKWSYAPRLFYRHPSVSVSGTVAASLLGNVFLGAPSMWLPGEQLLLEDGGFSQEDGGFSRKDHGFSRGDGHRVPPASDGGAPECSTSPSGAQGSPSLERLDLGRKRVMCTYLWWWGVRSSVCREAVMGTWAPPEPALLEATAAWCKLPWLGSHYCCLLAFCSLLALLSVAGKGFWLTQKPLQNLNFRRMKNENVPEAQWGTCGAAPFWVDYK